MAEELQNCSSPDHILSWETGTSDAECFGDITAKELQVSHACQLTQPHAPWTCKHETICPSKKILFQNWISSQIFPLWSLYEYFVSNHLPTNVSKETTLVSASFKTRFSVTTPRKYARRQFTKAACVLWLCQASTESRQQPIVHYLLQGYQRRMSCPCKPGYSLPHGRSPLLQTSPVESPASSHPQVCMWWFPIALFALESKPISILSIVN